MNIADSIKKPFEEHNIDLLGVFLVTGIVIVSAVAWMQILRPVGKAVEDAVETATGG